MGNKFTLTIHLDHCDNDENEINNDDDDDDYDGSSTTSILYAGGILKGKIIVTVLRGKVKADTLCLQLIGKENTIISTSQWSPFPLPLPRSSSTTTSTTTTTKKKKRILYVQQKIKKNDQTTL